MTAPAMAETSKRANFRIRAIYRAGSGDVHADWPADRIDEALGDERGLLWFDIENRNGDLAAIEAILRERFGFHALAIDDALHETHVPKIDDWDRYVYTVFLAIDFDPARSELRTEEIDAFLGGNFLVTYHEGPARVLDRLRQAIERDDRGRLKRGAGHLLYQLFDLTVADYLTAIEHLDEGIDQAQDEVFGNPHPKTLRRIFRIKRAAARLNRLISPQREVMNRLARDPFESVDPEERVYFRDVYDHLVRIHDITEGLRDLIAGALDTYLSAVSNRTNEIMKILTIVNVLFLPLSIVVGFFGMNFFGETLAFPFPLPRTLLFSLTCLSMILIPLFIWKWSRRRGWL